ncbi:MAG TPA: TatD family hydrolase [Patescibacteria group bacterium]|nr:TatD family hydrolase [Patescibacteria group bacterium]
MFIDTHCHLMFEQFNDDRAMVIGNAKKAGVKQFICPGVDMFSSTLAIQLARNNAGVVFASIGFHPYEASHEHDLNALEQLILSSRTPIRDPDSGNNKDGFQVKPGMTIIAIGEIGLDYHLFKGEVAAGKKQEQKILFEEQLRIALNHNLPVIMHCRDAYEDFFDVMDNVPTMPRGVIHCFSGGLQDLREAKRRNLFVGIDGNLTFSKQLQLIVPSIPLSMILLETDSPYLTPIPHRGQRNEPKNIPLVAHKIAELLNIPYTEVEEQTTKNARTLFTLPT